MQFYFVFDGFDGGGEEFGGDLASEIKKRILTNAEEIARTFKFENHEKECRAVLRKLARSDRKRFNVARAVPRHLAPAILRELETSGIITREKSRETPPPRSLPSRRLPRELRRYHVQDKIHFRDNFTRFWFYFCEPNLNALRAGRADEVLERVENGLWEYFSLPFELACCDFLSLKFEIAREEIASYWDKNDEIDIYCEFGMHSLVGEVKYRERKVCKDVLSRLVSKCERAGLEPDFYVIFSKSGFSRELAQMANDKILLFELNDFKELL